MTDSKFEDYIAQEIGYGSCELLEKIKVGVKVISLHKKLIGEVFTEADVFGDTNLELPSFRSNRSLIEVHLDIGSKLSSRHKDEVEFNIELPLHARYQPLGHGFSRVEFCPPNLFVQCSIERKTKERCLFPLSYCNAESKADEVLWEIPCGDKEHAGIVSAITFMSAILSALLIILISIYYSGSNDCPDFKQL
nr:phosphatidylinositol-glycan biosynthesis class X protein-like [Ipomoea batatas]